VPALCGLAQLLAETEWERARALADEALSYEPGLGYVGAMLASGWVALAGADRERAHRLAVEAVEIARRRRDRLGLSEALLLQAVSGDDQGAEDHLLVEAVGLLDQVGAPLWGAQVRLEQARRLGGTAGRDVAVAVEQTAEALGARPLAAKAAELRRAIDARAAETLVSVATLGGFRVRRGERIIRVADWRDDSARALLKRLSARSSLEAPRTALARSLWPELDADNAAARLDEAVEHLRASLDPDQTFAADYFLIADGESVALNGGHVDVDIRRFLADAEAGLDPRADVDQPAARDLLRRAESCYAGDYLEEHPGEQWADALREEARARYVEIARALASDATASGDYEAAARFCRRILERDPYDERAHLALAESLSAAGRHGEARRCYGIYVQRLQELGLEAIPFPLFGADPTRVEVA
jgi:DNA-binding SARP family transcriptional activator